MTLLKENIIQAVKTGDLQRVKSITEGCDVNLQEIVDENGSHILALASSGNHVGIVEYLLSSADFPQNLSLGEGNIGTKPQPITSCSAQIKSGILNDPLILAAKNNNFKIVQLLRDRGYSIPEVRWRLTSVEYKDRIQRYEAQRLLYEAMASPAYIAMTYEDPVRQAFHVSKQLRHCSNRGEREVR